MVFSFQHFECICPSSLVLKALTRNVMRISDWRSFVSVVIHFSRLFSRLCLWLLKLTITCLTVGLFEFILLEVHWASWCFCSCLPSNLGDQSLFLQISLYPFLSPPSPLELLAFFQSFFFQFLRLSHSHCLSSNLLILPSTCSDLVNFSFQLLNFLVQNFFSSSL